MRSFGGTAFYTHYMATAKRDLTESKTSVLPADLWFHVLRTIVDELDVDGMCSVSVIARELCTFGFVSRDLNAAMWRALQLLGQRCPRLREKDKWDLLFQKPWFFNIEWLADIEDALNIQLPVSVEWLHQKETEYILRDLKISKIPRVPFNVLVWVGIERNCNFLQAPKRLETIFEHAVDQAKVERIVLQYYFITLKKGCLPKKHLETLWYFRKDLKNKYNDLRRMEHKFKIKFMKTPNLRCSCILFLTVHNTLFKHLIGTRYDTWFHKNPYSLM